jgi:hypothetical protein
MTNNEYAANRLGDAVVAAIMAAERAGLSERVIARIVTGEMAIRPGYPKITVTDLPAPTLYDIVENDEYSGDGGARGVALDLATAKQACEIGWLEAAEMSGEKYSHLEWSGPDRVGAYEGSARYTIRFGPRSPVRTFTYTYTLVPGAK